MKKLFVSGTDTDVGKTVVSRLMLEMLAHKYGKVVGFKPISAGCEITQDGLRNEDALTLQAASTLNLDYDLINPIAFEPPIAPHIAAKEVNQTLNLVKLQDAMDAIRVHQPSLLLTEGAGGWRLPLNNNGEYLSDFVIQNQMEVVLVVGMRLGCLNHAVLTYQAIQRDGLKCVGWVANQCAGEMPYYQENLTSLKALINAPLLAEIEYSTSPQLSNFDELLKI